MTPEPPKPDLRSEPQSASGDTVHTHGTIAPASGRPTFAEALLAPAQRPDEIGRLGAYRVLAELGCGGMGIVYRAEDSALQRQVALKALLPELAADPTARARFLREARAQAKVEHDHITAIHAVEEAAGTAFIVMPLLKGRTLGAALKLDPRPPLSEAVRIGREIAEGLAAAHAVGLVHRDIKPGNIWLEGPRRRVKVLDFGLARSTEIRANGEFATSSNTIVGTPAYMAPEQARSLSIDARADLFSLGVVLYQMATGTLPFTGPSSFDVLAAVVSRTPPLAHEVVPGVPRALSELIRQLMAKNPAHRPASAEVVARELAAIGRAAPVLPVSPSASDPWAEIVPSEDDDATEYDVERPRVPKWGQWGAVGAVAVVALIGFAWAVSHFTKPEPPAQTEVAKTDSEPAPVHPKVGGGTELTVDKTNADREPTEKKNAETPPVDVLARPTGGLVFDGKSTFVAIPKIQLDDDDLPLTFAAWITPASVGESHIFLLGSPGGGIGLNANGAFGVRVFDGQNWHSDFSTTRLKPGETVHVAAVVTKEQLRLFIDGKPAGKKDIHIGTWPAPKPPGAIGRPAPPARECYFHGTIHAIHVGRGEWYSGSFNPPLRFHLDESTVALYRFDEGTGTKLTDSSPRALHGTIENGTWLAPKK